MNICIDTCSDMCEDVAFPKRRLEIDNGHEPVPVYVVNSHDPRAGAFLRPSPLTSPTRQIVPMFGCPLIRRDPGYPQQAHHTPFSRNSPRACTIMPQAITPQHRMLYRHAACPPCVQSLSIDQPGNHNQPGSTEQSSACSC